MAGLDNIAAQADQFEKETAAAGEFSADEQQTIVDQLDAAADRAEALLRILGVGAKAFIDNRLDLPPEEIEQGRACLAPVIEKYGLAGDGGGIPYQEEITAGFYLGGLWRRFRRALAELREVDRAKAEAEKDSGNQRKHQSEEQSRPVPGEVGVREKSDAPPPRWSTE